MINNLLSMNKRIVFLTLCIAVLVFFWSVPGTIALRNLAIIGVVFGIFFLRRHISGSEFLSRIPAPIYFFGVLTLFILAHSLVLSTDTAWSLKEFTRQWLKSLFLLVLGLLAGYLVTGKRIDFSFGNLCALIVGVMSSQIIFTLGDDLYFWWSSGISPLGRAVLTGSKTGMSYVTNFTVAMLVADLLSRFCGNKNKKLLPWPLFVSISLLGISLICTVLLGARNGAIGIISLTSSALLLYAFDKKGSMSSRRFLAYCAMGVVALISMGVVAYKSDSRWASFNESAQLAWDIDNSAIWRSKFTSADLPRLSSGQEVDESAFLRITWFHAGLRLIEKHPFGVGYGRNAFGHAIILDYPDAPTGHSHSSLIDFVLGVGIPGYLLWAVFLVLSIHLGWRAWIKSGDARGVLLMFLVTGFWGRSLIDSNMRDHMMEMFAFYLGLFIAALVFDKVENAKS